MQNITKIISSSLVAVLAFGSVAFAESYQSSLEAYSPATQSNGNSAGTVVTGPSTQSNGNSAGTDTTSTGSGSTPSTSPVVSRGGGSGGSSSGRHLSITNVTVTVANNIATVSWDSTPAVTGRIVYGTKSVTVPTNEVFYGYTQGTAYSAVTSKHSYSFAMVAGQTYFVRPIIATQTMIVYGSELKVVSTTVVKTAAPAVGTVMFDTPTQIKIDTTIPEGVDVSKANTNTANVSHSGFFGFLRFIWNKLTESHR